MGANRLQPTQAKSPETKNRSEDDSWVDRTADRVAEILREEGLDMELVVFFDPIAEILHAVGYDGSAARYFQSLEAVGRPSGSPAPRGNPMPENINQPAQSQRTPNNEVRT
jgi:hypothetical protein